MHFLMKFLIPHSILIVGIPIYNGKFLVGSFCFLK